MERKRVSFTLMPEYGGYSVEFAGRKITTGNPADGIRGQ